MRSQLRVLLVVISFAACVRTTPQPPNAPPPAPKFAVPEGCLDSLAGPWVHASDPSWRYVAEDDGGTLTLVLSRHFVEDAGFSPRRFRRDAGAEDAGLVEADAGTNPDAGTSPDAGTEPLAASSIRLELRRTEHGFLGETLAPVTHPTGRTCDARFPSLVLSCADGGLLVQTQTATALGDACQAPALPQAVPSQEHLLIRPPDAG